jgi:hypothetical protein
MKKKKLIAIGSLLLMMTVTYAQDGPQTHTLDYDPDKFKIIPDKVFEIGLPLFFLFLLLNTIVSVMKNRAANRLTEKMIDKGIGEQTLQQLSRDQHVVTKLQPLKWFLFSFAVATGLITIHLLRTYLINQSGYLAMGILLFYLSIAFLIYYRMLSKRL